MKWLKNVVIDLILPIIIALAVFLQSPGLKITVYVLAALLLLSRLMVLSQKQMLSTLKKKNQPPQIFFHIINALCIILLVYAQWWILVGLWLIIWFLSWYSTRNLTAKKR